MVVLDEFWVFFFLLGKFHYLFDFFFFFWLLYLFGINQPPKCGFIVIIYIQKKKSHHQDKDSVKLLTYGFFQKRSLEDQNLGVVFVWVVQMYIYMESPSLGQIQWNFFLCLQRELGRGGRGVCFVRVHMYIRKGTPPQYILIPWNLCHL